jgi:hypothetical protein
MNLRLRFQAYARAQRYAEAPFATAFGLGGVTSHNALANKLNERNVPTGRGGKWTQVHALARAAR